MTQTVADLKDTGVTVAPEAVVNEILPFCAQGQVGRDLLSQADYTADMQRNIGHQPGIARASLANKQARQVSHVAAGLAQFLARRYAPGVVDDGDLDKVEAALVGALDAVIKSPAHLATLLRAGLMQPDGATVTVDEDGLLSALGGNLLLNSDQWITESGTFAAPVDSWYDVLLISGGGGGFWRLSGSNISLNSGISGAYYHKLLRLSAGQEIPVVIGAGGLSGNDTGGALGDSMYGGTTSFGDLAVGVGGTLGYCFPWQHKTAAQNTFEWISGVGLGGANGSSRSITSADFYGGAGGCGAGNGTPYATPGKQGAVYLRWHDPAKAGGPLPEPALLSVRKAARRAAPATVSLYDPATGQGSVWREEDEEARLAEGLITEEAWTEICAARAAEEYAAWLANPETEAERFEMLRAARDARLATTDYLVAPDYPLTGEGKAAVTAYRQALRDLPAQEGAPWDGGGELTPWPEMPAVGNVQEA